MAATKSVNSPNLSMESLGMNSSNDSSFKLSPCNYLSLMSEGKNKMRKSSPAFIKIKTPNISPIAPITEEFLEESTSPSLEFLRRLNSPKPANKDFLNPGATPANTPNPNNSNLEHTLSVKSILKDLNLLKYENLFTQEEIDLTVFMSLDEKDLKTIGITDQDDITKILNSIGLLSYKKLHLTNSPY